MPSEDHRIHLCKPRTAIPVTPLAAISGIQQRSVGYVNRGRFFSDPPEAEDTGRLYHHLAILARPDVPKQRDLSSKPPDA